MPSRRAKSKANPNLKKKYMRLIVSTSEIMMYYNLTSESGARNKKRTILDSLGKNDKKPKGLNIFELAAYEDATIQQIKAFLDINSEN